MRTKKRSEYIYPPEKMKEWREKSKKNRSPERIAEVKAYQKEYFKAYRQKKMELGIKTRSNQPPIPEKKICTRCKIEKIKDDFRIRVDKRMEPHFEYLNSRCRKCDAEVTIEIYRRTKDKNRAKNNEKAREYYKKNKERIHAYEKKRRKLPEYKKYVKQYYDKNRERILANHRNVCRRAVIELRDWVIVGRFSQHKNKDLRPILKGNKELIDVMRLQTILKKTILTAKKNK